MSRALARVQLTPEERRAVESAAAKMVADNAIAAARLRRAPIWEDRRAMLGLLIQGIVATVAVLALLHAIRPGLP